MSPAPASTTSLTGDGGDNWLWGGSDGSGVTGNDIICRAAAATTSSRSAPATTCCDGGAGNDTFSLFGNSTDITAAGVTVSLALAGRARTPSRA